MTTAVKQSADHTGTSAIFAVNPSCREQAVSLRRLQAKEIRLSANDLLQPGIEEFISGSGVTTLWLEFHPHLFPETDAYFFARLANISADCRCICIVTDIQTLLYLIESPQPPEIIALKGRESSGFVGKETTGILFATARQHLIHTGTNTRLVIWGGIATPEAAAAFLCSGAAGIVFESLHWHTGLVAASTEWRQRLSRLQPEHTSVVGYDLGINCRLLDRGNFPAVKALQRYAAERSVAEDIDAATADFAQRILQQEIPAQESSLGSNEIVAIGPEAAFASDFAARFGMDTTLALQSFSAEIQHCCNRAKYKTSFLLDSPTAKSMGIGFPLIQGAMSWISDLSKFARAIAEAGALPTIALGLRDQRYLSQQLADLESLLDGRPYAVNLIALAENPYLEDQSAWILEQQPPFVVIAAGEPSYAKRFLEQDIEVIFIAADAGMMELALAAGIRYLILEGNEAGGHIGRHSLLTLAQIMLEFKRRAPAMFSSATIIHAGGIFNRETAFRALMLGADAIQMGTPYLVTREIVDTGALSDLYQRRVVTAPPSATVIRGESSGLRVRALQSPKTESIWALEQEYLSGQMPAASLRGQLEALSSASLLIAARGVEYPEGPPLAAAFCQREGQFMAGSAAGNINRISSVAGLHLEITRGAFEPVAPNLTQINRPKGRGMQSKTDPSERIAITAMAQINALGRNPLEIWEATLGMESGIIEVPDHRWEHAHFYDPIPMVAEKSYCKSGAFMNLDMDRKSLGVAPQDFRTMSTSTRLTLWLAQQIIEESGIQEASTPRERIGVITSQNSGEVASTLTDIISRYEAERIIDRFGRLLQIPRQERAAGFEQVKSHYLRIDDTTLLGRTNSLASGQICNRYGFMGPSFAMSAACASSLAALYSAVQMMRSGVLDAALVGGAEEALTPIHYLEFCALGALAGVSGRQTTPKESSRPFDADRDGMVLGEGGAMLLLERESQARARGAHIHALINGTGAGNSIGGLVESLAGSQQQAIAAAFREAGFRSESVDLVECHATGTVQGDIEEVKALDAVYSSGRKTILASYKSQIGHTLGASGLNSLIRGVCAMQAGVFPATLNYRQADSRIGLEDAGFLVPTQPLDWPRPQHELRRLQVNAFGFGGANYVALLEENPDSTTVAANPAARAAQTSQVRMATEPAHEPDGVVCLHLRLEGQAYRCGLLAATKAAAQAKLAGLQPPLADADPTAKKCQRAWAKQGVFAVATSTRAKPLALIFPGQGAAYAGMGRALYARFEHLRSWLDRLLEQAGSELRNILFGTDGKLLAETIHQQPALFILEVAIARQLMAEGVTADALAGHSVGELSALCLAGVFSWQNGLRIVEYRARLMQAAGLALHDQGRLLAVSVTPGSVAALEDKLAPHSEVFITHYNSSLQIVIGGSTAALNRFADGIRKDGYQAVPLPVNMAFHTPLFEDVGDELAVMLEKIEFHPPRIPVVSNSTGLFFSENPEEIKALVSLQMARPVLWQQDLQHLQAKKAIGVFVEVGPGRVLKDLVTDTLNDVQCISTCISGAELDTFRMALARLYSLGSRVIDPVTEVEFPASSAVFPHIGRRSDSSPTPTGALQKRGAMAAGDYLEQVIQIIMDATGYERDEIEADMDIREDLAIRSSRLPVIIDAAERRFGIVVQLHEFIGVRTVNDLAARVAMVAARDGVVARDPENTGPTLMSRPQVTAGKQSSLDSLSLKRFIFRQKALPEAPEKYFTMKPGQEVAILTLGPKSTLASEVAGYLRNRFDSRPSFINLTSSEASDNNPELAVTQPLVGVILVLEANDEHPLHHAETMVAMLTRIFSMIKQLLSSSLAGICITVMHNPDHGLNPTVLKEGVLGLMLAATQEYPSVLFRVIELDEDSEVAKALAYALDSDSGLVEMNFHDNRGYGLQAEPVPLTVAKTGRLRLTPGDVVVLSGGVRGIGARLAKSLAAFQPRLVLLGRSDDLISQAESVDTSTSRTDGRVAREIATSLQDLQEHGISAEYLRCDVSDSSQVQQAMTSIIERYGRIDGIIHGAGILQDAFLEFMSAEDFSAVVEVKLLGAWNLYHNARKHGLRFMFGLSSVAAIIGSAGQTNYCAANRAMSALLQRLPGEVDGAGIVTRALMLPPVSGTGMLDDPEIKELMKLKGLEHAFVDVSELSELFCRELFLTSAASSTRSAWIMLGRELPQLPATLAPTGNGENPAVPMTSAGVCFAAKDLPMIQTIDSLDLRAGCLQAVRPIGTGFDLWLEDHRPYLTIEHPLMSGIMAVEIMLEAAKLLYPYLQPLRIRRLSFRNLLECPAGTQREVRIRCRLVSTAGPEKICEIILSSQDLGTDGQITENWISNFRGEVIMGSCRVTQQTKQTFSLDADSLDKPVYRCAEIQNWYQKYSNLQGRYRVLESIDGIWQGLSRGSMIYRNSVDFRGLDGVDYQYSPYLLEAMMHLVAATERHWDQEDTRRIIPAGISELSFSRNCRDGERIVLEACRKSTSENGQSWDLLATDEAGVVLMQARGLEMIYLAGNSDTNAP